SQLGPIDEKTRKIIMQASDMAQKYNSTVDRESAFELLRKRAEAAAQAAEKAEDEEERLEEEEREFKAARRYDGGKTGKSTSRRSSSNIFGSALASAVAKELKGTTGRRLVRGILGGLFKGR
ncbi:MAG: putative membrane protein YdbT with pleckstrin-like domain, partial [Yoonia sp.]